MLYGSTPAETMAERRVDACRVAEEDIFEGCLWVARYVRKMEDYNTDLGYY